MKKNLLFFTIALLSGLLGAFIFNYFYPRQELYFTHQNYPQAGFTSQSKSAMMQAGDDFVLASATATPCVVYITTVSANRYDQRNWFDWYFNGRGGQSISSGSGVIYSSDGYIITNNHVVNDAENIEVVHEKKTYKAKLVGKDPSTDL